MMILRCKGGAWVYMGKFQLIRFLVSRVYFLQQVFQARFFLLLPLVVVLVLAILPSLLFVFVFLFLLMSLLILFGFVSIALLLSYVVCAFVFPVYPFPLHGALLVD
uniref:Uncharacterized protein n=1 Tax=Cacopsylla melanoneura TaxID=428564 RepID=A0A8D8ZHC2_9HEMI